jgi:uncharacterized protein (TIGR02271 family)
MSTTLPGTVVGYFATEAQAESAVSALQQAGFSPNQIGLALNDPSAAGAGTIAHSTAHSTTGAKAEGAWERFKSLFEGPSDGDIEPYADEKARGSLQSHEITPAGGYYHDDFGDTLGGMDVSPERSRYFGHQLGSGSGAVVTVSAQGREAEAEMILADAGGDTGADASTYDYGTAADTYDTRANTNDTAAAGTLPSDDTLTGQRRIQLLGEVLRVHKDRISRGEVRIRKEVITEQQTVQVPVTREELVIERIPVDAQSAPAGTIGADSEIRIPLTEEVASAEKQTVVREEIAIGKKQIEDVQQVAGSVRHEELAVEDETVPTRSSSGTL